MQLIILELQTTVELPLNVPIPVHAKLNSKCRHFLTKPDTGDTIDDWAAELHMSRRAFTRLFRQETGMGLSEWRQQATVVTALSRLASGESVTSVALDCGYSNAGAFSSMFRRITGATPTNYFL
jgi:AraC-like DNA-binding protein